MPHQEVRARWVTAWHVVAFDAITGSRNIIASLLPPEALSTAVLCYLCVLSAYA